VCVYSVCVVLCVGRGFPAVDSCTRSPTVCRIKKMKRRPKPNQRSVVPWIITIITMKIIKIGLFAYGTSTLVADLSLNCCPYGLNSFTKCKYSVMLN
jgi:hypothetical protein